MADNVVGLPVVTTLDCDPERIIDAARGKLTGVVVLGYTRDGMEYFASSYADGGEVLWLLERLKMLLLTAEAPERKSTPEGVEATVLRFPTTDTL